MSNYVPLDWQVAADVVCAVGVISCVLYVGAYLLVRLASAFEEWRDGND